jgi:hypothetical protein
MRNEFLSWFAREGLLLTDVLSPWADPDIDEIKITVRAPLVALSRSGHDFRECPDPVLFGYPEDCLDLLTLDDLHEFVFCWLEYSVSSGMARCFVCNRLLEPGEASPWDAVFVSDPFYCWLVVHFDCKRYLNRDLKGRNPFEVSVQPPELFDLPLM